MDRWMGKIAVVTGASIGIGQAISKTLAENGLIVVGLARKIEKIQNYSTNAKGSIHAIKCDLTIKEDILKAFRQIEEKFGGVDVLINNAGVHTISGLTDDSIDEWERVITTNVLSLSVCTNEAVKSMSKRGDDGYIINMNSLSGHRIALPDKASMYTASKHAVTVLTEMLRNELRNKQSKIKVTSLSPGIVNTDMAAALIKGLSGKELPSNEGEYPVALSSQDLADMVVFLLSCKPYVEIQEMKLQAKSTYFHEFLSNRN